MKVNWKHLIFIALMITGWLIFVGSLARYEMKKKEKRQEYLRETYSPMNEDTEIQEAYNIIRNKQK